MAPITDHQAYCEAMQGSLAHKLFFLESLPFLSNLLDYGCADGVLLRHIHQSNPSTLLLGYDRDEVMLQRGNEHWKQDPLGPYVIYLNDEALAFSLLQKREKPTGILFSSVLHELYSQRSQADMVNFWQRVAGTNVDYIIVRDMYWGAQGQEKLGSIRSELYNVVRKFDSSHTQMVEEFEGQTGDSIAISKHFAHFLLKIPYTCNWQRELEEDYFSLPDLRPVLAKLGYEVILWDHHQVDYIQERIKADTGIELPFKTHLKAIFKRVR